MRRPTPVSGLLAAGTLVVPATALAHSFGRAFNLPVPFWLYAWGAVAALVASFIAMAYFGGVPQVQTTQTAGEPGRRAWTAAPRQVLPLQLFGLGAWALCVATGWFGTRSPYGNFNMTFFWVVFVLGFTYLAALLGDVYALSNPWRLVTGAIARVVPRYGSGLVRYPAWLGHWPALALYMTFIWVELFGATTPHALATLLFAYGLLNLVGVGLVGAAAWFGYCELFSVLFRLFGQMAPLDVRAAAQRGAPDRIRLRAPLSGVPDARVESFGMLAFLLFALSSTSFDGLRDTVVWHRLFWVDLYRAGLQDWVGRNPLAAFPAMRTLFAWWQTFWLVASPWIYLSLYLLFIAIQQRLVRSALSRRELAFRFAPTLLPIALVYNLTHYYTLIQTQGVKIVSLASDPFGRGWDLFGTADWFQYTIIPDPNVVWHTQVVLIVLGHIVSVVLAHRLALRLYASRRDAILSQLPMLALMLLFTTAGLWILSQPLAGAG